MHGRGTDFGDTDLYQTLPIQVFLGLLLIHTQKRYENGLYDQIPYNLVHFTLEGWQRAGNVPGTKKCWHNGLKIMKTFLYFQWNANNVEYG